MNIEDLKYYKLISRIQSAIGKSASYYDAIARMADRVVRLRDGKVYEVTVNRNPKKVTELVW